ncbi:MAG: DUF547 domain-containing protein [Planctomycetaceae bacterium]
MKEKERIVVTGLVVLLLLLWLGFLLHQSPRFAGSLWGGVLGVCGAALMLVPLAYLVVKRIKRLKKVVSKKVSMRTLLAWHVYAGILGPILVLLHTGHKFESPLGIALTAMTLIVVISGFVGRYLMSRFSSEIREKRKTLAQLEAAYRHAAGELANQPDREQLLRPFAGVFGRLTAGFFMREGVVAVSARPNSPSTDVGTMVRLSESIADVEYAIKTHETFKTWFGKWLKIHILISIILYLLMALHVWGAIHFGLRWFDSWNTSASYLNRSTTRNADLSSRSNPLIGASEARESAAAVERFSRHFGRLFRRYWHTPVVIHGRKTTVFDYAGIAGEVRRPESDFSRARLALERVTPRRLGGGNREKAFWINVYNFGAMKLAAENYPVSSITDAKVSKGDPWSLRGLRIGTERYALRQIEKEILLKKFDDPRIVFAVSCAAVSCPDRTDEIFSGAIIDRQLDDIVRGLLANSTKGLAIDRPRKVVTISWILKSDRRLFGDGSDDGLLDFVRRYASAENRNWIDANRGEIQVEFFKHDWALNDTALADTKN